MKGGIVASIFTDEKTKTQRGKLTAQAPSAQKWQSQDTSKFVFPCPKVVSSPPF